MQGSKAASLVEEAPWLSLFARTTRPVHTAPRRPQSPIYSPDLVHWEEHSTSSALLQKRGCWLMCHSPDGAAILSAPLSGGPPKHSRYPVKAGVFLRPEKPRPIQVCAGHPHHWGSPERTWHQAVHRPAGLWPVLRTLSHTAGPSRRG